MARCILMVGPARSGTSVTAAVVQALGVKLSPDLIGPHPEHNPMGHYESAAWHALNRELRDQGRSTPNADQLVRYQALVDRDRAEPAWGVKDPAFCYTLPAVARIVRTHARDDVRIVAIHRPFRASAASRERHSRLSPEAAVRAQVGERAAFYRALLESQDDAAQIFHVDYDRLVRSPRRVAAALSHFCLGGVDRAAVNLAASLVEPTLRHHGEPVHAPR